VSFEQIYLLWDKFISLLKSEDVYMLTSWNAGSWKFLDTTNGSSRFPDIRKTNGNSVIELVSTPTKISGVHYVQVQCWTILLISQEFGFHMLYIFLFVLLETVFTYYAFIWNINGFCITLEVIKVPMNLIIFLFWRTKKSSLLYYFIY